MAIGSDTHIPVTSGKTTLYSSTSKSNGKLSEKKETPISGRRDVFMTSSLGLEKTDSGFCFSLTLAVQHTFLSLSAICVKYVMIGIVLYNLWVCKDQSINAPLAL